ncbi:ABC transporter substrate-binding protein [Halanaerocella petrolearia]
MKSRMVGVLLLVVVVGSIMVGCSSQQAVKQAEKIKIGITQIVEHPALDAARKGFIDELKEQGYKLGEDVIYDYKNAQGDMSTVQTIANSFAQDKLDMILAIATPTAQAVANTVEETPIIFSAVTDPKKAGLVDSYQQPGNNITGASDLTPVGEQFKLFKRLDAGIEKIGIIYNSGESNSVFLADLAKEKSKELGLELVSATVTSSSEVYQAAQSLTGRVDAIYIPTDNTVASAIQSVVKVANENKLPLVVADNSLVEAGAVATLGIDYYQLGRKSGQVAAKVLAGKDPGQMPVEYTKDTSLIINRKAADKINLEVPEELVKEAEKVIE